jgi:flagellar biosynthesis/type III secretory pathway M-ring protein FliF/YscJ
VLHIPAIGTLAPVEAQDRLQGANGDGMIERARSSPWLIVAIALGAILILAWVAWAIYVTSSDGATAGLGVVIAWPAMLAALALISLPFIGGYLLIRRLSEDGESSAMAEGGVDEGEEGPEELAEEESAEEEGDDSDEDDEEPEESAEEEDEESDEDDEEPEESAEEEGEESDDDDESDAGAEAAKS